MHDRHLRDSSHKPDAQDMLWYIRLQSLHVVVLHATAPSKRSPSQGCHDCHGSTSGTLSELWLLQAAFM